MQPLFPSSIWNGLSPSRSFPWDNSEPTAEDFTRLGLEINAMQQFILDNFDEDGNLITTGDNALNPLVTKGTDPTVTTIGDLLTITTKDIIVAVGSSAVASVATAYSVPANSLVIGAAANIESTITLATATKIGVGVAGTLSKYATITGGTKNAKSTLSMATVVAADEAVLVYATDNSHAAAGTIQNGSIRIRLFLMTQAALPNAA